MVQNTLFTNTLRIVVTRLDSQIILTTILLLSWGCCTSSVVSKTYVDLQLIANMLLEAFLGNVAASCGAIMAFFNNQGLLLRIEFA